MCPSRGRPALLALCAGLPLLCGLADPAGSLPRLNAAAPWARRGGSPCCALAGRGGALRGPSPWRAGQGPLPRHSAATSNAEPEAGKEQKWTYNPVNRLRANIRTTPDIEGVPSGHKLGPGDSFLVSEVQEGADGVLFLRLADGRGWLFNRKPGVGRMCTKEPKRTPLGDVVIDPPGGKHECTLIYLHGFSRTGEEYLDDGPLGFSMPWNTGGDKASGLRAVLPTARRLRQPWGEVQPSWYGYAAEYMNDVGDQASLNETRERLGKIVCEEVARLDGAGRRVFLGGASQGCTAALDVYLREASALRLGGFVGSIGFVPSDRFGFAGADRALSRLLADPNQARMPIWMQCATDDRSVPWKSVARPSLKRARGAMPDMVVREVCGRGHGIEDWEAHIVNDFLRVHMHHMYTFK